ncbi:MAG: HlyD family type I secretion periplasmic adaptor subunit [Pseudomonadales bacterium]|nr:HlyD family type I secretion periplasmic adaptor subunit [Pseudomonadales bacterium]
MDVFEKTDDFWRYHPLLWTLVALVLVFLAWASFSEIDQHVRAMGRVVPSGNARTVQHLEGGIVEEILVHEGQTVKAGETLFLVANTMAKSRLRETHLEQQSLIATRLRLEAELAGAQTITFPESFARENPDLTRSESALFDANRRQFEEAINALNERLRQKTLALDALTARVQNLEKEQTITARQAQIKQQLYKSGATSEAQYLDAISNHRKLVTQLEQARNEIPILRAEHIELESTLKETRQEHDAKLSESLNQAKLDLKQYSERISAFQDEVSRSAIPSPIDGVLNKLYINTVGGVIQAGAPIAEITPANEVLVVEGQISTLDRGKVWPTLPVLTKITAYDYTVYGGVTGELTYISPDSFIDNQNIEHFKVRVSLTTDHIQDRPDLAIRPGMTAEVSILTGKISVLNALLKPLNRIGSRALRET